MVNITDTARDKLKEALEKYEGKYLRLSIEGMG